jgi:hypothetical protein
MKHNAAQLMRRASVKAVRDGASVTDTARRYGVSRSTLQRWLRAFDPEHPMASLRPEKPGPKTPRWDDATLGFVIDLIGDMSLALPSNRDVCRATNGADIALPWP